MSGYEEGYIETEQGDANEEYFPTTYQSPRQKPRPRRGLRSMLWNKFTIVDRVKCIASCDICGMHLSYKSTVSNLKNHLVRKHKYDITTGSAIKSKSNIIVGHKVPTRIRLSEQSGSTLRRFKPKVSQVGVIDDLIFKADVGEDETHHASVNILRDQVVNEPIEVEDHSDYTLTTMQTPEGANSVQTDSSHQHRETDENYQPGRPAHKRIYIDDKKKRQRILDLQLECLEMKKYNMQIETLMMEQQMNLPRSIFTETLRCSHTYTRGTQTDIGGDKTKVFYLSNTNGAAVHHFISLQDSVA